LQETFRSVDIFVSLGVALTKGNHIVVGSDMFLDVKSRMVSGSRLNTVPLSEDIFAMDE
jgi:hypothetical protein